MLPRIDQWQYWKYTKLVHLIIVSKMQLNFQFKNMIWCNWGLCRMFSTVPLPDENKSEFEIISHGHQSSKRARHVHDKWKWKWKNVMFECDILLDVIEFSWCNLSQQPLAAPSNTCTRIHMHIYVHIRICIKIKNINVITSSINSKETSNSSADVSQIFSERCMKRGPVNG